jgi:ribosomal protein S18 acetylase RimI-like enzyme
MRSMADAASFSVIERLRDGTQIEIRALRPSDRNALLDAAGRTSDESLYRRFFGVRREFNDAEVASFVDVDFIEQVALVALMGARERELIVAGARYIVVRPGTAELAVTVVDEFQGLGIASVLLRHLAGLARAARLSELVAEVMPDNTAMLRVLERSGLRQRKKPESSVIHVTLYLD